MDKGRGRNNILNYASQLQAIFVLVPDCQFGAKFRVISAKNDPFLVNMHSKCHPEIRMES